MANDKANSLLDAISIIAEGVVKKYRYDQTIEAKIVSVARKDQGIYKCEYQNAIFDAYSNDTQSFYENETVYVNIPQGDFSKQKHIVGRKVDLEAAPDRTFNFRMPFDDFVGLESLTALVPSQGRKGFLANYPEHGGHQEVSAQYFDAVKPYNQQLAALDGEYQQQITELADTVKALKTRLTADYLSEKWYLVIATAGTRLSLVKFDDNYNYLEKLTADCEAGNVDDLEEHFAAYKDARNAKPSLPVEIGSEDIKILTAAIDKYEKMQTESITAQWISRRETIVNNLNNAVRAFTANNYSHIWSWRNEDSKPKMLVETKLGLAIDIETNIGTYMPQAGEYGLRIVITGITKATEEESSTTKTVEYIWTNDEMYGNTYAFYTPYTQQKILDISAFLTLDQIDIFFYQNTDNIYSQGTVYIDGQEQEQKIARNFLDINYDVIPYSYQDASGRSYLLPYNIYYNNLSVALGLTTDECSTDRVLLYTYDDVMFGEDPFATDSRIAKDTRNLKFAWIHRTESGNIVLVDHAKKTNARDIRALESYNAEIHWYHFEYGVAQDTTILAQKQGGVNWRFMDDAVDSEGRYWLFEQNVIPDIRKAQEKWKAIVTFNGVPYASTPLVFTNIDTSVETSAADAINEVAFRILREGLDEQGNRVIIEDNSLTNFFVYDENGICIQNDENLTWSDLWFYIQVWIRNNDDGSYTPLPLAVEDDYNNSLFEIEWQMPTTNTMLDQIQTVSDADLDNAVLAPTLESNIAGYNDAIRSCTRKFKIKHRWDMRAINNTIAAIVKRNGRIYKPQQEFMFGQSGNMGSPYTVALRQVLPENGNMIQNEEFEVEANVFDSTGAQVSSRNFIFSWELLSPTIVTAGKLDPLEGLTWKSAFAALKPISRQTSNNVNNVIHGVIRNSYPLILRVTVTGAVDYPITQTTGFSLVDNQAVNSNYRINCPSKIEFKSDGKLPITVNSNFEVFMIQSGLATRQVHPEWQLAQYLRTGDDWSQLPVDQIKYIGLKDSTVADTTIVTNSNPVVYYNPNNYDDGFSLTSTEILTIASTYGALKKAIKDAQDEESDANDSTDENVGLEIEYRYRDRMNALNRAVGSLVPTYKSYALDPYVNYSAGSQVQWQWKDELANYYYTVIQFNYGANYFKQAIPFTRNVYSSSLLNSWDGTTQIDEANGAVLAQKISAGAKDKDNRFTGVIMGDWADKADNSLDTPGLYGLKYGEQVFGFKTDGTGFIGKSGKGRIEFNGNKSLISNSDKTCYLNLDPVIYTLNDDGSIHGLNDYTGFSQYFLYAKTKKTSTASVDGEDSIDQSTYWAHDFMDDPANDYFVVDPNNGVLTTGGVIARYGKIGNWMISSAGLYQKYSQGTQLTDKRYMYLGYPNLDKDKLAAIRQKYADLLAANERRRQQAIGSKNADFLWEEVGVIGDYYKAIFKLDPYHYFNAGWPLGRAADVIDDALDSYNEFVAALTPERRVEIEALSLGSGSNNTFENKVYYTLLTDLQRVAKYVSVDDVFRRYHAHYTFNADGTVYRVTPDIDIYGLVYAWNYVLPIVNVTATRDMSRIDFQGNHRFGVPNTLSVTARSSVVRRTYTPINNYYGQDAENSAEVRAANVWSAQWPNYTKTQAMPQVISAYGDTLSREQLSIASAWLRGAYQYHLDGYTKQLVQMINAAIAAGELPQSIQDAYNAAKARHEAELAEYIRTVIDPLYDRLAANINSRMEKELQDEMINGDQNRYAIFAGYTSDIDPLFSVNWRGYMTARAGKLGEKSPWYISDEGLTQKNNYGTIFLGNPESKSDGSDWTDLGLSNDMDNLSNILLPNDRNGALQGPLVLGASDETATYGHFAIYAGNKGYHWKYNLLLKRYERELDDKATIKFGVRMDGTLYALTGRLGGWYFNEQMIYSYPVDPTATAIKDAQENLLVLDSGRGIISLGNAVVLSADGNITLGAYNELTGETTGSIYIAGFQFLGKTNQNIEYTIPSYNIADGTSQTIISPADNVKYWGGKIEYDTITITPHKSYNGTTAKTISVEGTLEIKNRTENSASVILASGIDENNNTLMAFYPSKDNSVLGTKSKRWDIIGDTIICNTIDITQGSINAKNIFMQNELVATEAWVLNKLADLAKQIPTTGGGSSGGGARSYGAAGSLAKSIAALEQLLSKTLGTDNFLVDNIVWEDSKLKFKKAHYVITDWTNPAISSSDDPGSDTVAEGSGNISEYQDAETITIRAFNILWSDGDSDSISDVVTDLTKTKFAETSYKPDSSNQIKLTIENKTVRSFLQFSFDTTLKLSHTHKPEFKAPSGNSGTVELTIGDADFSKTTSEKATFDVVSTTWYASQKIDKSSNTTTASTQTLKLFNSEGTYSYGKDYALALDEDVSNKKVYLKHGNGTIATVSTQETYDAGWTAARSSFVYVSSNTQTIALPSATVGTKTTYTITASVSGGGGGGGYSSVKIQSSSPGSGWSDKGTISSGDVGKRIYVSHVSGGSSGSAVLSIT